MATTSDRLFFDDSAVVDAVVLRLEQLLRLTHLGALRNHNLRSLAAANTPLGLLSLKLDAFERL